MNRVTLDKTYALQANNANAASGKTAANSQTFAALLAMQTNTALQKGVSGSTDSSSSSSYSSFDNYTLPLMLQNSLSDAVSGSTDSKDDTKNLVMMLCLMMCSGSMGQEGGTSNSMMMSLLSALTGSSTGIDASSIANNIKTGSLSDLTKVTSKLPANAKGSAIVQSALSRLGDPYSKAKRGTGDYVDCSSLAQWAYAQAGISIPSTSVMQAKYCYDKGYTISKDQLQPGDLVFWSKTSCDCGRWNEIHHVGVYAGDGKVVEAKTSTKGVVLDDLWESKDWKIVMYARPQ